VNFMVFLCLLSKLTLLLIDLLYLLQAYLGEVEKVTRVSFRPVQNQRDEKGAGSPLLARTEYVEAALIELERERLTRVQEEFQKRRLSLDRVLREEIVREAAVLTLVEKDKEAKCELARRSDKQDQRMM
jgi:hypothetical protein